MAFIQCAFKSGALDAETNFYVALPDNFENSKVLYLLHGLSDGHTNWMRYTSVEKYVRERGITVPIIPGIMPITNANQVERAIQLSGSFMPQRFKSLVDKFGTDPDAMKQAGIAYATDQIIDLFANGITNVHVYSMNKPDVAVKIMSNLSDILKK